MQDPAPTSAPSVDTRTRIVEVAARMLHDDGAAAVTTRSVAQGAGVQAPAIYRLFGDKEGLLDAVAEHVMATYIAAKKLTALAEASAGLDPLDDLRAAWTSQIEFGLANPALFRLLSDPARGRESPAARAGVGVLRARVGRVAETGRLRVSEERAVGLIQAAGTGSITTVLATPAELRDESLPDAMFEAVLAAILTPGEGGADAGTDARADSDAVVAAAAALRARAPQLSALSERERALLIDWLDRSIDALA